MSARPTVFVSAVSKELKSARQLVANTLQFLGYEPVWQDIFGTEHGDLRAMLRRKIDGCKGVVQLVGHRYGAEPAEPDAQFGRVSYTQYEVLYARQRGKRVWYLMLDEGFPLEQAEPESEELRELQAAYRRRLQADSHLFHPLNTVDGLEADVLKLRNDLSRLRRGAKLWAAGVAALLTLIAVLGVLLVVQQRRMADQVAMVMKFAEVQARQERAGRGGAAVEEATYAELAKEYRVDKNTLKDELPRRAKELQRAPDSTAFERANAAYVAGDYPEAERLALQAAAEAQRATPPRVSDAIKALKSAGFVALRRVEYADALRHLRAAEKLTDRQHNAAEWADVQFDLAHILYQKGNFREAEAVARNELNERLRWSGSETRETLYSRNNLAAALERQGRYTEAEKEYREVLAVRERLLGADDYETLVSRNNLAVVLADSGQLVEAEKQDRIVLAALTRLLGPENPDTLISRHILGVLLAREERNPEAEKELRAVLDIQTRVQGAEHPDTLRCRNDLAAALDDSGAHAEAEKEHRAVLAIRERVLGPEHPDTLTSRGNLAYVLEEEGRHAEAEAEDLRTLVIRERVLGPEHPDTLGTRQHLAFVFLAQGKNAEAGEEFAALLTVQEHLYGSDGAETFKTRQRLAFTLYRQGKYGEAIRHQQMALTVAQKGSGEDGRRLTAEAWFALSRYELFARDFAGVLAAAEAGLALKPDYPSLVAKRAHAYLFLQKEPEAEQIYRAHRGEIVDAATQLTWEQLVLKDFDDLEKAGLTHPAMPRFRELLRTDTK